MLCTGNNFIKRSIKSAISFLKDSVFSEEYALKDGFLQSIDPRIKTLSLLLFLLVGVSIKNILVLSCIYFSCLVLAAVSRINFVYFLIRTWVFIPLFSLFIAIPALFSFVSPGEPLYSFNILQFKLVITRQGLGGAVLFLTRVVTSVSLVVLLGLTTRHIELLRVLRFFRVPKVFVMVTGMCYRYVYLFVEILENTYIAIKSRVGRSMHYRKGQAVASWNMAYLWQRSYKLNQDVYDAMRARGYTGEVRVLDKFKSKRKDLVWLFIAFVILVSAVLINSVAF